MGSTSTHRVALSFEDGVTRFIEVRPGETVADAAYRQGVNVPIDCRDGACGACKCHCESGPFVLGDHLEDALSADEAEQGYVLTCQMRPEGDCVVRVPASSAACKTRPGSFAARVEALARPGPGAIRLRLQGDELKRLSFLPGQYANVEVPGSGQSRAYSFSSLARDGSVEFLIRNVPGGLMSSWLSERASLGDDIAISGPLGSFYLREIRRPVLMLAGGTGLAPFLAMLERIVADGGSAHPIHLMYGVNTDADVVELDRLEDFARRLPGFSFDVVVVDPASAHPRTGYVTQHMTPTLFHDGDVDVYLCGPPPMVEAVTAELRTRGVVPAALYHEKFAPSA